MGRGLVSKTSRMKAANVGDDGEDRISRLPDQIIGQILSLLPTRNAVATSILSKRWRYLWTNITTLSFYDYNYSASDHTIQSKRLFYNFVGRVLHQCGTKQIERFCLRSRKVELNQAEAWINEAIKRNAYELELDISSVPSCVFTCETLTVLKFRIPCSFVRVPKLEIPTRCHLPRVRTLHLETFGLSNKLVGEFLHGCPVLEDLSLVAYHDASSEFNFSAPGLKRLRFHHHLNDSSCKIVINAPNLIYVDLHDAILADYEMENLLSIAEAKLHTENTLLSTLEVQTTANRVVKLLAGLSNIESLSLCPSMIRGLYDALYVVREPHRLPIFYNLTRLEWLHYDPNRWSILLQFLEVSPRLRVLIWKTACDRFGTVHSGNASDWNESVNLPGCSLPCLELVEIEGFEGRGYELKMVEYLLVQAAVLKKLIVNPKGVMTSETKAKLYQRLLELPKSSKKCQIYFLE